MPIRIDNKYDIGDVVYVKTDLEQRPGMVFKIQLYPEKSICYAITRDSRVSEHYEFELSSEKDKTSPLL